MKSIFQKLYGGEIYPDQNVVPDTEEYDRDRQESSECMCALENALTKEQRILLDEAMAARSKLEYHESTVMYGAGVRFGIELMRELPRAARVRPVIRLRVKKNNEVVRMEKRKTLLERLYDSCWETYMAKLRELTINQLSEQTTEIAAAALCYRELRNISWQKTWIEYFNQVENPLAEAQNAMLTMLSEETYRNFDVAMCGLMDQADLERGHNKEAVQEQSMQV